ncbi:hypothetical protein [Rodentibacter genomosp. 2]|uniref:Uncharacterized protein n=1 Tax=Rodentibacter genomosp. 2 TaxID=1908266 RepID=A0A1V3JAE1_9PAST|nr:hypothetical protein [Rodentibacter genomosp. 2]OOF53335.1 hypothetical protein BKK55_11300 [Rodentibacter genomosp. 2]
MKKVIIFNLTTMTMLFIALILNFIEKGINVYTYIALSALTIQSFVFINVLQINKQRKNLEKILEKLIDKELIKLDDASIGDRVIPYYSLHEIEQDDKTKRKVTEIVKQNCNTKITLVIKE